ncbi:MAG: pyridoxal phosphate-dependent aminotransferase [Candidatus Saliniplasma sp.]
MTISYPEKSSETPLDSNENLLLPERYYKEIKDKVDFGLRKYPSPTAKGLMKALSELYDLNPDQILVGNGSDAILDTAIKTFVPKDGTFGYFQPSYEMYSFFAFRNDRKSLEIPLNQDFTYPSIHDFVDESDMLMICSPNNPSGLTIDVDKLTSILERDVQIVVDEAYVEYSEQDILHLLNRYKNLTLIRTFSKAYGLAGIRVGYALTSKENRVKLQERMLPYNVNAFSIKAAIYALQNRGMVKEAVEKTIEERNFITSKLKELGFDPISSETNFVLSKTPSNITPEELFDGLIEMGIRIRIFNYPRLKRYVRITVADRDTNLDLLDAVSNLLK